MALYPVNFEHGRVVQLPTAASITFVKGNAVVDNGSGYLTNAASSTAVDVKYIALEGKTTGAAAGELLKVYKVDESVRVHADCDAAPAQTDVHTVADLAGAGSINPDASTNDLFYIESIDLADGAVGTSTKVYGYFTHGAPNS